MSLSTKFPEIAKEWHPEKNGDLKPQDVSPKSHKRAWWLCPESTCEHPHEWEVYIHSRTSRNRRSSCPFCTNRKFLCPCTSLAKMYPDLLKEWHPEKNGDLNPEEISPRTHRKVWWLCPKSNCDHPHEWEAAIGERTRQKPTGCPFCPGRLLCYCNSLAKLRPDLVKEWHPEKNGNLKPENVSLKSGKKVWWICSKSSCEHPHEWQSTISNRSDKGSGCPFCTHQKCPCKCVSFAILYPELLKDWDYDKNKNLDPSCVYPGYNLHVWWLCSKCNNSWRARLLARTFRKTQCKQCHPGSIGEEKVKAVLDRSNITYKKEYVLKPTRMRADFYISSQNLIIEYDGSQHFGQKFFTPLANIKRLDDLKNNYCKDKGISLFRICYKDIELIESLVKNVLSKEGHFIEFSPSYKIFRY